MIDPADDREAEADKEADRVRAHEETEELLRRQADELREDAAREADAHE